MSIIVGNKDRLALEYVNSDTDRTLGYLFLYVNGIRFGEDYFDFDVNAMIQHTLTYFKLDRTEFPELFECPAKKLFDSFDIAWSENVGIEELNGKIIPCDADKYMPSFIENFATFDDLDSCVFRYVQYAFDRCTIILIPAGDKLRLYVKNRDSEQCTDVITSINEFIKLWQDLSDEFWVSSG